LAFCFLASTDGSAGESAFGKARKLMKVGEYEKAAATFDALAESKPSIANIFMHGWSKIRAGRFAEGEAELQRTIELSQRWIAVSHLKIGTSRMMQHDYQKAAEEYGMATALLPDWAEAHHHYGRALHAAGKKADGVAAVKRALELKPTLAISHYQLALFHMSAKEFVEARQRLQQATELDPELQPARELLGRLNASLSRQPPPVSNDKK
jgi:tetratricopeptide (TPR) repeat protein